jgi:hypothetical protein
MKARRGLWILFSNRKETNQYIDINIWGFDREYWREHTKNAKLDTYSREHHHFVDRGLPNPNYIQTMLGILNHSCCRHLEAHKTILFSVS